jgi:hypothetical protein
MPPMGCGASNERVLSVEGQQEQTKKFMLSAQGLLFLRQFIASLSNS